MNALRKAGWTAPIVCLLIAAAAQAGNHTTPTYFPNPAPGPYTKVKKPSNPWNLKCKHCKTPEERYRKYLLDYALIDAQHRAALRHLDWDDYHDYITPPQNSSAGFVGRCNANPGGRGACAQRGCATCGAGQAARVDASSAVRTVGFFRKSACDSCDEGCASDGAECVDDCGACASGPLARLRARLGGIGRRSCDDGCGAGRNGLLSRLRNHFGGHDARPERQLLTPRATAPRYPVMNREDAVRYVEGFQNYPPYQVIRSPRDFFMFNERFGHGR